jgi:hypothetical protein
MLLGLLVGWIPGWPDLSTRIVGVWVADDDPSRRTVEFTADGRLLVEQPPQQELFGPLPIFGPEHYQFIGRDRIRVHSTLLLSRLEHVERVAIDGDVLTLTTEQSSIKRPGDVRRYRWVKPSVPRRMRSVPRVLPEE